MDEIVSQLRQRAAMGQTAVQLSTWLSDELGSESSFFMFISCMFSAFKIPVETLRGAEKWSGFGWGGSLSDDDLIQLLGPLISR